MKIDRSKLNRSSEELPAHCKTLTDKLKTCTQEQLLNELKQIKSWTCGKCELYHWVDLLDVFDDILGDCCAKQHDNQWMLACDLPTMDPRKKELLMHIISFTALLIEHSFSRHLYSSMDHLITLLSSSDMQIVLSVLGLLFVFTKRSNFIGKLSIEKRQELLTRLSYLAESWGGKENGFGLAQCCRDLPISAYPSSATTLHFEYCISHHHHHHHHSSVVPSTNFNKQNSSISQAAAHSYSQALLRQPTTVSVSQPDADAPCETASDKKSISVIHIDNVDQIKGEQIATIMERLVATYNVPHDKQMQLFTRLRLAHCFSDPIKRMQCVQARLQAASIIIYCDLAATQALGPQLLHNGLIEELTDVLRLEGNEYIGVKSAALGALTSMVQLDRNSRLSSIVGAADTSSYHGFLPALDKNGTQQLHHVSRDGDSKKSQSRSNCEGTSRESLLTTSRGYTNYRGLLNLVLILLVLSNARVALENIIKYGILVDPLSCLWFFGQGSKHWPALLLVLNMGTHVLMALLIESLIAFLHTRRPRQSSMMMKLANVAIITNLLACIAVPPIVIFLKDTHPISTSGSLMIVSIVFLKLVSWHMVNFWCRDMRRDKKVQSRTTKSFLRTCSNLKSLAGYPANVSLANISSFMLFPTLCYELEFPRTQRIRKRFLTKRIVELLILVQLDIALVQQWIVPTVSNSVTPFRQMQFSHMLERLLKLAIPNHVIWLIWFYLFFHSWLNIVAELTRFADREFYRDWWNSESVYYFWTNWNIPVHKWCARHLYIPLMALGLNKCQASTAVFFVSAFFHEYLVSVPLKMFRMWAFTGMLVQLPWARFVSAYFNNQFANVAVWASLILGQPLCILMYYHDYYVFS